MKISMMWAMSQNRVIGKDNTLPWHLPNDLKHFKKITTGKTVIMGRKTYESIGRPLPNRVNIVVSRNPFFKVEGVFVTPNLKEALAAAAVVQNELDDHEARHDDPHNVTKAQVGLGNVQNYPMTGKATEEVVIMGGAQIYQEAFPYAERLYVTLIHAEVDGDTYFPDFDPDEFRVIEREDHQADENNPYDYSFLTLDRIQITK